MPPMDAMFPAIEPFAHGHLPVADGQDLYWETSGNPAGRPAVYLHGGPGGGIQGGYRRHFDPARFLIVGLEQRGCGRSRPLVGAPGGDLAHQTTPALIADLEALRAHLGVEAWLLYGASWGTTLALAYAQAHPAAVTGLVLGAVTTTSAAEVDWITERLRRVFPREWDAFAGACGARPGQRLIDAYADRLADPDPAVRDAAAAAWCAWEDVHVSLAPGHAPDARFAEPAFRWRFATLVTHYWRHAGFAEGEGLLARMGRLAHLPGVLIHGRLDVSSPLETAWDLHRAWPGSELVVLPDEGHGGPAMAAAVTRAVARLDAAAR